MSITPEDLELKGLRLNLIDIVSDLTGGRVSYSPLLCVFDEELEDLVGLSQQQQRKILESIALRVVNGGRKDAR